MKPILAACVIALATLATAPLASADIGQIKTLTGAVHVLRGGERLPARLGLPLLAEDVVQTGGDGSVGITFVDNSRMAAGPDSRIELSRFRFDPVTHEGEFVTSVARGTLTVSSGQMARHSPEAMRVHTPTSVLAVRGTRFLVAVE